MAKTERGGVRLVVENYEQFNRQLQAASRTMSGFGQSAQQTAQAINASASEYRGSSVAIESWTETVDTSSDATLAAADSFLVLGAALTALSAKMATTVVGATLVASRIKELELLLDVTRQNAVYNAQAQGDMAKAMALSSSAVEGQVQGIRDLHLSGRVANETVARLIRYNLDWTKATEIARLAQDAATFAMQDSSQALDGLIHGITTLQPRVLRSYGIMINLNEAYRVYAKENNLVATQLTQAQRQQAAFNAVLAQGPAIAGAYEASLGSATKQLRSTYTDTQNLAEAYGEFLEPALASLVRTYRGFLQVLTELPAPIRAMATGLAAGGTATLTLTAGTATAISGLVRLRSAMAGLTGTALAASSALLGIGGALTVAISAVLALTAYVEAQEQAQDELEASILSSTDSYVDYTEKMREAGLEQEILAEAIWDTVHAKEAEAKIDAAQAYIEAQDAAEGLVHTLRNIPAGVDALELLAQGMQQIAADDKLAQVFAEDDKYLNQLMDSILVFRGESGDAAREVVEGWQLVAEALQTTATLAEQQEAIAFIENLKTEMDLTGKEGVQMEIILNAVIDAIGGLGSATASTYQEMIDHTEELNEAFMSTLTKERMRERTEAIRNFLEGVNEAMDKANQSMEDADLRRNRALEDLDIEYHNKSIDAWIDYQRELRDIEGDLAAFHAGTLNELLDLDREYLQDRNDAWVQYQQGLADAERDLQRDIEDASRDRAEKLADLDADYARDREDALRNLNQDLEDNAEEHAQNLIDIERDRQESLLDLEQEYQNKLFDIQNLAQQRLADLQDEYDEKASDTRLKYLRQALEQIEAEGWFVGQAYRDLLREAFLTGEGEAGAAIVPRDFRDAYFAMLKELEDLQDDMLWEEEDLSDDIDREQDRRLEGLEEWLAEEQAAIEAAYAEKIAAEHERFEEEQAARRQDYERKLEDLQRAHEREQAEIALNHQRRLDDIRRQAEREREELAQTYARRLEDLEIEYNRERELIGQKLEEQNQEARQKYKDALADLATAKERERDEINKQYDRTIEDTEDKLGEMVTKAAEKWGLLPDALKPTYRVTKDDWWGFLFNDPDSLAAGLDEFIDFLHRRLDWRSPSGLMMDLGRDLVLGLKKGVGNESINDILGDSFDVSALEANIQAALPANMASMPMMAGGGSRSYSTANNLTVNAQYQHQGEASLRDDLALYNMMMGAW